MLIPNATAVPPVGAPAYAAVFIDFENVYYFLKNHYLDPQDPHDYALDLLRSLRDTLKRDHGLESLVLNAYADFDKLPAGSQGPLYLMGVSTRNVLGTDHKNAADMQLCIDALEVFYTRPAIGTFVLVAGDRDYIPVIQHLRRQARQVQVVGFRESVSGDLLQMLGQEHFIDARGLLPPERLQTLEDHRAARLARGEQIRRQRQQAQAGALSARPAALHGASSPPPLAPPADGSQVADAAAPYHAPPGPEGAPGEAAAFAPIRRVLSDNARRCLEYLLEQVQRYGSQQAGPPEIWASPFLRRLTDVLPELPDWERRQLLTQLRDDGVVRMEKREGEPHAFSVIILNNQHPDVRELLPLIEQKAKEAEDQAESSEQPDALPD
ncbi:NYN domain-containing protein [Hymenobacter sp. RP-2-7]|uniref:NYN domain-containing protein n=1 Tax=Hymenobacter polaris TaxID=2682546 RepID=A0A7Y0ACX0_9BACT|nr:NYN domain-containing protein [Hymenobacter polaris]NML65044.1 NYN domain-containing protein [Hymenobacter polaris]